MVKLWVHLLCFLVVGLNACRAARLMPQIKELNIAQAQTLKAEVAFEEVAEMKPCNTSENNVLEFQVREIRTGGDAEHESSGLKIQGLSTSEPSPAVGHMEVSRSGGKVGRILGSTPSPGRGH